MRRRYFLFPLFLIILLSVYLWYIFYKGTNVHSSFTSLDSEKTHIYFANNIEETEEFNILTNEYIYNGGGVAIADFNNDGLEDIYFTGSMVDNKLYLNKGNFVFEDVTELSASACSGYWCMGIATIDINEDGLMDMYISVSGKTNADSRKNILLVNQGLDEKGVPKFENQANKYGIDYNGYSINAYFFDYNKDGLLDLFVINNHFTNRGNVLSTSALGKKKLVENNKNILYKNIDGAKFEDVTEVSGLLDDGFSLSAIVFDANNDDWLDIFVSNDFVTSSILYINQKNGKFSDETDRYLKHQSFSSMGVDVADFNNDGWDDLISVDMLPDSLSRTKRMFSKSNFLFYDILKKYGEKPQFMRNCLYSQNPNLTYNEISQLAGVHNTDWSWAPIFADFNNDGLKDLYVTNGFPKDLTDLDFISYRDSYESILKSRQELIELIPVVKIPNVMFENKGDFMFERVTRNWNLEIPSFSYGLGVADLDKDGDLDMVVNNLNDKAFVFRNNTPKQHFIRLKLRGVKGNRMALNTKVELFCQDSLNQVSVVNPYRGYLSSLSPIVHFGLKQATKIDSIKIYWKENEISVLKNIDINQELEVDYSSIPKQKEYVATKPPSFLEEVSNLFGVSFIHKENKGYDFYAFELLQRVYTNEGPPIAVGDINGDNLEDIIIGQGLGAKSSIFFQKNNAIFVEKTLTIDAEDKELTALSLFDVDKDGDLDLYLGYGHCSSSNITQLKDEIAINDGTGNFIIKENALPDFYSHTSDILVHDFDNDKDLDLFVFSRVDIFKYPTSPQARMLINNDGKFEDVTEVVLPENGFLGMITDAELLDINKDGLMDIIVCGEWMGVRALINKGNNYTFNDSYFPDKINGLWNCITVEDIDDDGDVDLVVGNYGYNLPYAVSADKPLLMKYADFEDIGTIVPLIFSNEGENYYPIHLRDNVLNKFQSKKKTFKNYRSYSEATMSNFLTEQEWSKAETMELHTLSSVIFENKGKNFKAHPLSMEAQFAPVFDIFVQDVNQDGVKEIALIGNDPTAEVFTGPQNAMNGLLISVKKDFSFDVWTSSQSGFVVNGFGKKIETVNINGEKYIIATQNGGKALVFGKSESN